MAILPASYPGTKKGYNAYVKALGYDPTQVDLHMYVITLSQFVTINRETIDSKIADAAEWCEKMHVNAINAHPSDREYYEKRGDFFSKKFIELVRQKYS
jgi:hypothetical protein